MVGGGFMSAQPVGDYVGSPGEDTAEDNRAPPPASGFGGFTTAGGRKLEVSKEALRRASRLLNNGDDDDNETTTSAAGSPPDTAHDDTMDLEAEQQQEPFVEFRSGRGKAVVVSEASLAKARHLVMDRADGNGNDAAEAGALSPEESAPPAFVGFTTGSGRRLEPPKASVEQAMKRFLSDDGVGDDNYEESLAGQHATSSGEAPPQAFVGFTTGSGRRLRPAAENVKRAMDRLLADDDDDDGDDDSHANGDHPNRAPPAFAGFTTGSGKRLAPPKASVEQAMKRFLADDGDGDGSSAVSAGAPTSGFVGFTTGSGRRLEPPKASVEQAMKRLLNDDDDDGEGNGNAAQQSPGRRGEGAGAETLDDYDALNGPPPPESFGGAGGAAFGGFKTVSGKAINVSAAALARSRQLLADADEEGGNAQRAGKRGEKDGDGDYDALNEPPPAAFGGFKTVSGKAINVSAAALARSRQLLANADADADGEGDSAQPRFDQDGDGDFEAINGPPPPESFGGADGAAFGGFKTVSGKAVNVSAAALARSRQLLAEVGDDVEGGNAQSAGKRPPREKDGDDDYDALNGPPPPESFGGAGEAAFGGFKTVSGKAVNVSAAALARSRQLLADAEADVNADANRDPSALARSSPPRANASSRLDEEDEDDDADMLLELSSCADDEPAPARPHSVPAARAAAASPRAPRPAPTPQRPAAATPLGPPVARSNSSSHLVPSPKPTGRSEFAYPPTPVRATPPRPTSTTAFTTSTTTTTTTTTATSRAATDPPRVVVTTPRAPAAASSSAGNAATTGQLTRRGPLGGNATGDRRGGAGGAGAPPAKQYAYGCSPYKPPRAHTPARPSRRQAALAATAAPVPEAAPLPPWRYSLPEVSEKLTLKQLAANEPQGLPAPPLSEEVLRMDSDRARHYQFTCEQVFEDMRAHPAAFVLFFSPQAMAALNNPSGVGAAEMHAVLLACGANPKIISPEWTSNHYRWIVWKLAGMERRFPHQLANRHLLPHTVLHQLLYRYEREVNKAKRSALKIILERDESAGRSMILCVAAIRSYGGDAPPPPPATSSTTEGGAAAAGAGGGEGAGGGVIEVTDGWYSINAILDEALTQHMALGKIYPGLKLRVIGARLNGNDNAMSPLEATESTTLLLQVNAVRRALWHAKLGIQRKPVFPVSLRSVRPEGGLVPCVDVVVERRYPLLFLEKKLDGSFITRTSAQEEHARRLFEAKRNRLVEAKKAELEKEASAQASAVTKSKPRTRSPVSKAALAECYDGETLLGWMEGASDPYEFQQLLNARQQAIVQHHMERSRLDKDEEFGRQLEDFIAEHPDATRTVTPFVRVRLRDCPVVVAGDQRPPRSSGSGSGSGGKSDECVLTIWRPNEEELAEIFEEGARLRIYFLNPRPPKPAGPSDDGTAMTGGWAAKPRTLELSTTLKTRYARREGPSGVYRARQVQGLEHLHAQQQQQQHQRGFREASREIDVVGVVVGVHGPHECSYKSGRPYLLTQVFLTDASGELLSVELRERPDVAVSRFPFKEAPATPTVVCLSSLAYRSYDANFGVHHAFAEEATDVLLAPKGRSSPFVPAYRQLVAWAEQSREEVDAARQRVEALVTGQLVPRSSSTRPGVPVRASLVGALLPFSAVACLPRAGQPSDGWDICLWPASATPPPARFPPRPTTSSPSADHMNEDHHHHQQQADVALYVLLDDGLARHRLALALPDIVAALDLLRPAHHHLVPVERWLWRCLSSPAPAGPDPSQQQQQQQLRDLLLADLFGGVRFPDDARAEALSLPSPTALVGEALALALLHSTRPGAAEGTAPALPVPLPGSASTQTPPDGEAPSRPLLLACEEWDGFVAALSASLSTAYDDLEVICEDRTQTGWWHVQSVRRRTEPPST